MEEVLLRLLRRYGSFTDKDFDRWMSGERTYLDDKGFLVCVPKLRKGRIRGLSDDSLIIPPVFGKSMEWNTWIPVLYELVRDGKVQVSTKDGLQVYSSNSTPTDESDSHPCQGE